MKYIILTTPPVTSLRRMTKYRDINPPITVPRGKHPCWGENIAERKTEVSNKHSDLGTQKSQQKLCLGNNPNNNLEKEDTNMPGI